MINARSALGRKVGLICFSAKCSDPVIWAHYSGRHTGICLGFDIPSLEEPDQQRFKRVRYIEQSLQFPADFRELGAQEQNPILQDMLYTKFKRWAYEEEIRLWALVTDEEDGIYYADFESNVTKLAEVIVGAECSVPKKAIERALRVGEFKDVMIRKMKPAAKNFGMEFDPDW